MKNFIFERRDCDCCGSRDIEELSSYSIKNRTLSDIYLWKVRNVICRKCGFAFVSPVPGNDMLRQYYGDSFALAQVNYSIGKRMDLIRKYRTGRTPSFLEIGGNNSSDFHKELSKHFSKICTMEINQSCTSVYRNAGDVPDNSMDMAAAYFVLEHITRPRDFLLSYRKKLKDGGVLIMEIPNLYIYPQNPAGIFQCEHLNHFSPVTLRNMAAACGYEMLEVSQNGCSRVFGFVAVLRKTGRKASVKTDPMEYMYGKSCMQEGYENILRLDENMASARKSILSMSKKGKPVIIWGANWICLRLLDNFKIPGNIVLIDKDLKKRDYIRDVQVHLPEDAVKRIRESSFFIINTRYYADEIVAWIAEHAKRKLQKSEYCVLDYY
ncbi:MAG: methyltransferase domain-containing protein [Victivallales bacterium]